MSNPQKLEYVRIGLDGVERFEKLFSRAFQTPLPGYFRWKYIDNPAGSAIGFEARDGKTIAGFYGAMPEVWNVNGKPVTLFQSMDTMTDPDYRGRGLFVDLANLTMKAIADEHSGWMIGFPGHTSIGGFVGKLGWKDIAHVRILFSLRQILSLSSMIRSSPDYDLERVYQAGAEFDEYWSRRDTGPMEIQKQYSARVINWRIFDRPGNVSQLHYVRVNNQIAGVIVHWSDSGSTRVQMCDFLTEELYAACVPSALSRIARISNSRWVEMYEPNLPWARRELRRAGTIINSLKHGRFSHHRPFIVWTSDTFKMNADVYKYSNYDMHALVLDY